MATSPPSQYKMWRRQNYDSSPTFLAKNYKKIIFFLLLMFKNFPTLWSLLEVFSTFLPSPKACHISDLPLQVSPYFPLHSSSWTSPTFRCTPTPMHCLVLSISLLTCNVLNLLVMHHS